jgi:general secretion pathway protein G
MIGTELEEFHDDWGRYPTTGEGLKVLAAPSKSGVPYFQKPGYGADTWDNPFVYRSPARTSRRPYDLYSLGPNGLDEGGRGDDINYWSARHSPKTTDPGSVDGRNPDKQPGASSH